LVDGVRQQDSIGVAPIRVGLAEGGTNESNKSHFGAWTDVVGDSDCLSRNANLDVVVAGVGIVIAISGGVALRVGVGSPIRVGITG
jgi:hypothetical protein